MSAAFFWCFFGYGAVEQMRKMVLASVIWAAGAVAVWAEDVVIAALGDSLTQGFGLAAPDGFVPQLQSWLDAQGIEARVINAGVSGDTTAGGLARVAWTLTPEVDAMIVALGGNDLLRGLDPAQARANIGGILEAADTAGVEVLLVGMQAPGNFGAVYKTQFDAIYPALAKEYGTLFFDSFFEGLSPNGTATDLAQVRALMQADGIHPNAEGVQRIVASIGPKVAELAANAQ